MIRSFLRGNEVGTTTVATNTVDLKTDKTNQSDNASPTDHKMLACQKELEERGQFSAFDFVAGAEGVGEGLEKSIKRYVNEKKIRIPMLFYCPGCKVENVVIVQNNVELKFTEATKNSDWQKWLGSDWHMYISEKIDFDEKVFADAFFYRMRTHLPPFISEYPSTVQATINGEQVKYANR